MSAERTPAGSFESLPLSDPVETFEALPPTRKAFEGRFVALAPLDPQRDAEELYACSHGDPQTEALWTYLSYGPFAGPAQMKEWLKGCAASGDPLFFSVFDKVRALRVGMVSFMRVKTTMRSIELGNIWYGPVAQRTKVNTEAIYLMLRECFQELRYRRVEWKCNALNARSRQAALRLGFSYEGIFRQHMIVKGRNRDTAWFAMLDGQWPAIRKNTERWLYSTDPGLSLGLLNAQGSRPS